MTRLRRTLPVLFLITFLLVPLASAHGSAAPPDYMTRLLADCNDDYFGSDGGLSTPSGHDLHSLDAYESWDKTHGDKLTFRLILNGDSEGTVTLDYKQDGAAKTASWSTTDGSTWKGAGFDRISGPTPALDADGNPDGDRFVLTGTLDLSQHGLAAGDKISDYTLTGTSGGKEADHVPGNDGLSVCSNSSGGSYVRSVGYTLAGPVQYASLAADGSAALQPDTEKFVDISIANLLRHQAQKVTLSITDVSGAVEARFHDVATGYTETTTLALNEKGQSGASNLVHLALMAPAGASGSLTVVLTTELGGHVEKTISYSVSDAPAPSTTPPVTTDASEPTPGFGIVAALGLLALARRRR